MKKALIITYYWPPGGGSGVQRWLKFVRYLPSFDIRPVVLTVDEKKASYPLLDPSLADDIPPGTDVYRTGTSEIYSLYKTLGFKKEIPHSGFANEGNPGLFQKVSRFIRGNLFIPDPRIGWNRFAYRQALEIIANEKPGCIITSSPPHSTQVIGLMLKKKFDLPWIADLRDPWTDIYYYHNFYHLPFAKRIDSRLERQVLEQADAVIVVSERIRQLFLGKSAAIRPEKVHVIPNGYDGRDFPETKPVTRDQFTITYTGTLSDEYEIGAFLEALKEVTKGKEGSCIRVNFTGKISDRWREQVEKMGMAHLFHFRDHVPHGESVALLTDSSLLLLVIPKILNNEGILTGKLFEYLAARKPILCIGPADGDAAAILRECEAGGTFGYDDAEGIRNYLAGIPGCRDAGILQGPEGNGKHTRFERKNLTGSLAEVIRKLDP